MDIDEFRVHNRRGVGRDGRGPGGPMFLEQNMGLVSHWIIDQIQPRSSELLDVGRRPGNPTVATRSPLEPGESWLDDQTHPFHIESRERTPDRASQPGRAPRSVAFDEPAQKLGHLDRLADTLPRP